MRKIAFLLPDDEFVDVVEEAFREHLKKNPGDQDYAITIYVAQNYRDIPRQVLEADIVISRGLTSEELKRIYPNVPLVEIPIGAEMTATVMKAMEEHGKQPIAVIGSFNMAYSAYGVREIIDVDIKAYEQDSREDFSIRRYLDTAIADGRKIIICGPVTYKAALAKECHPYVLGMSKMSVRDAIARARDEMRVRGKEREKAAQLQSILASAHEGIITTDRSGKVTAFNAVAADILQISPARALDVSIREVLPHSAFTDSFRTSDNSEAVVKGHGGHISLRKSGVVLSGEVLGYVVTMQLCEGVQSPISIVNKR